jgi:hypothetical protein
MIINSISELPRRKQRVIIINYNTKYPALLALLSSLRYVKSPVLLIDCSTDDSFDFFKCKMEQHEFDLIGMPLQSHGLTLDKIFSETKDEQLLLVDSDIEILNRGIVEFMNQGINYSNAFGSGFLTENNLIDFNTKMKESLYYERPFIPLVLFNTHSIKQAINKGISFNANMVNNEFPLVPEKYHRYIKKLCSILKIDTRLFRKKYFNYRPKFVIYDTGAKMYEYLKRKELSFISLPYAEYKKYAIHLHGATRHVLNPWGGDKGKDLNNMDEIAVERLKNYGEKR